MNDLKKLKAIVDNPYFGAFKWNSSIEQLEAITNIFAKINKRFAGIYDYNKTYQLGDYVFINDNLYELSKDSTTHFKQLTSAEEKKKDIKTLRIVNNKLTTLDGTKLKQTYDFDFCKTNYFINETVCIKGTTAYVYNSYKDLLIPLNVSVSSNIKGTCLDEVSIYLSLERSIIEKSKTLDNITHEEIFNTTLLIKDICCNDDYVFGLLSDGRIAKINRKDKTVEYLETNKFFSEKAKISIVGKNNLFVIDNSLLYCFQIDSSLTLKSEIEHGITDRITQIEKFNYELFITDENGKTYVCKNTLYPVVKCDLRNILDNNKLIVEDIDAYINPQDNVLDTDLFTLVNKEILVVQKNKGIEVNRNKLIYKIKNNFINKTVYIKSEGVNGTYTFTTDRKTFNFEVTESGPKDIFVDIKNNLAIVYVNAKTTSYRKIVYLLPSVGNPSIEFNSKGTDSFIIKTVVIFNNLVDNSKKDRIKDNVLYLPKVDNYTNNLPYSNVVNDLNGTPILKTANKSLVMTNEGVKVNSSEDFITNANIEDSEKVLSIKGAKNLSNNFNNLLNSFNNDKANRLHRHPFTDLDNVPYATSESQGVVFLSNDITDSTPTKAATPYFVNLVNKNTNTRITDLINTTINGALKNIDNINNIVIPKINENIGEVNQNLIKGIKDLNDTIAAPTSYLDKNIGGIVKGDVTIRNIDFGENTMRFKKDSNDQTFLFFNRGFLNHGPSGQGIEVFKFAPTSYSNPTSGGIEIGYANGTAFTRTSYISSSGYAVFTGSNITGDVVIGRNITLYGDLVVTSDKRLKSDIKKVHDGLLLITNLNGYTFKKIDTGLYSAGVIAQEVQRVMPELIIEEDNRLKVNYNGLHAIEIEAIKELNAKIERLENEIIELKRG